MCSEHQRAFKACNSLRTHLLNCQRNGGGPGAVETTVPAAAPRDRWLPAQRHDSSGGAAWRHSRLVPVRRYQLLLSLCFAAVPYIKWCCMITMVEPQRFVSLPPNRDLEESAGQDEAAARLLAGAGGDPDVVQQRMRSGAWGAKPVCSRPQYLAAPKPAPTGTFQCAAVGCMAAAPAPTLPTAGPGLPAVPACLPSWSAHLQRWMRCMPASWEASTEERRLPWMSGGCCRCCVLVLLVLLWWRCLSTAAAADLVLAAASAAAPQADLVAGCLAPGLPPPLACHATSASSGIIHPRSLAPAFLHLFACPPQLPGG